MRKSKQTTHNKQNNNTKISTQYSLSILYNMELWFVRVESFLFASIDECFLVSEMKQKDLMQPAAERNRQQWTIAVPDSCSKQHFEKATRQRTVNTEPRTRLALRVRWITMHNNHQIHIGYCILPFWAVVVAMLHWCVDYRRACPLRLAATRCIPSYTNSTAIL